MKISEFARKANINVETVRYYQRLNLLRVPRSNGGYRQYQQEDLDDVMFIKKAQDAGFSLAEIKHLKSFHPVRDKPTILALSEAKKQKLVQKIGKLNEALLFLEKLINECKASEEANCPILTTLLSGKIQSQCKSDG